MEINIEKYVLDISKLIDKPFKKITIKMGQSVIFENGSAKSDYFEDYLKPHQGYGSYLKEIEVLFEKDLITSFVLYEFPSCCAFCVSTRALVRPEYREFGVNKRSNLFRQEIARYWGYSALICTDIATNIAERKTLKSNGFIDIYDIFNKRTSNRVYISVKKL